MWRKLDRFRKICCVSQHNTMSLFKEDINSARKGFFRYSLDVGLVINLLKKGIGYWLGDKRDGVWWYKAYSRVNLFLQLEMDQGIACMHVVSLHKLGRGESKLITLTCSNHSSSLLERTVSTSERTVSTSALTASLKGQFEYLYIFFWICLVTFIRVRCNHRNVCLADRTETIIIDRTLACTDCREW